MRPSDGIRVAQAGKKGRGIFATKHFMPDDLIERAPIIFIDDEDDFKVIQETILDNYWYTAEGGGAIALGFASLYNHSYRPNADFNFNEVTQIVEIVAIHEIKPGREICINYNGDPTCKRKLEFKGETYDKIEDEEKKSDKEYIHYGEYGSWHDEWAWCGLTTEDIAWSKNPHHVNCPECIKWMAKAKLALQHWKPKAPRKKQLNKTAIRAGLKWIADELRDQEAVEAADFAEDLENMVTTIPASTFPGYKKDKK